MKIKKEYIILGIVIIALAAYLAVRETDRVHYRLPQVEQYDDIGITRIKIEKPGAAVELEKQGENWVIARSGRRADTGQIRSMIDAIEHLEITAVVSAGGNYAPYSLDPENRIRVKAWAGQKPVRSFDIGKTAPSYRHTFVRLADDPRVFHASGSFRKDFAKTTDQLRDKTVVAFDAAGINRILAKKGGKTRELVRKESGKKRPETPTKEQAGKTPAPGEQGSRVWTDAGGAVVSEAEVKQLLDRVNGLTCKAFINGRARDDFTDPIYTLVLEGDTEEHTLRIYPMEAEAKNAYPAVSSGTPDPFTLAKSRAEAIMAHFFEEKPAAP